MSGTRADHRNDVTLPGAGAAQRRQVTVLFADMAGYTPLAGKLGEEKNYLLMQRLHRELSEAVHAHNGTVQELIGDGVMALFGAPVAIEDAPVRACRAALDIQSRMGVMGEEIEAEHGARPAFRIGLHSGPLVMGTLGDEHKMAVTALGDTVNLASRIEAEADSGAILMSEATHALVEGFVDSEHAIKGKAKPQKLWRLDGVEAGVSRFDVARGRGLTQLIGRRREIETLEESWQKATAGGVRVADIVGEAGIGKSRLAHEFRPYLDDGKTFFLSGHCTADGQATPFLPFIEVVRTSFRIPDDADAPEAGRKLARGLDVLGLEAEGILPYLLNLLGLAPADGGLDEIAGEVLGIRTRDAVAAMLRERCRLSPTALLIEDLHWIDSASEEPADACGWRNRGAAASHRLHLPARVPAAVVRPAERCRAAACTALGRQHGGAVSRTPGRHRVARSAHSRSDREVRRQPAVRRGDRQLSCRGGQPSCRRGRSELRPRRGGHGSPGHA